MDKSPRHLSARRKTSIKLAALATGSAVVLSGVMVPGQAAAAPPPGQDFNVTTGDLEFIIKQIDISEAHAEDTILEDEDSSPLCQTGATFNIAEQTHYDVDGDPCVGSPTLPFGLRTVDGRWNNLMPGQDGYGTSGKDFPRLLPADFKDADPIPGGGAPGGAPGTPTSYKSTDGEFVYDAEPRIISNLVVDQTTDNPAAVAASERIEGSGLVDGTAFSRTYGTTLFDTSAAISKANYNPSVPVVYIARADDYSDALAAGPAATASGGPLLLVNSNSIPASIRTQLARLQPQRIVVVGGDVAVTATVATTLQQFTAGAVTRQAGTTRYDTAAAISRANHPDGASKVFIATGLNFPDALAAAAPAARDGNPVLLVTRDGIPAATATELDRLNPSEIVVLGGPRAVSEPVFNELNGRDGATVTRIGGTTLYDTAAMISAEHYAPGVDTVYLTTGENFPDALSGSPAAGKQGAPILLVPRSGSVPASVAAELQRLKAKRAIILGGPLAVSAGVEDELAGLVGGSEMFIPDIATDEGLSASVTSFFTFFGQFFDHGLDQVSKGGNGTIVVPLQPDDPLYEEGSRTNFLTLSRATIGEDGSQEHINRTTPFVDQNQTYTSHPSHQAFLREYVAGENGPEVTGKLLNGAGGEGVATWNDVKNQARTVLGINLTDMDVLNVPMLRMDPYGHFVPGPNGYPQLVLEDGTMIEGDPANGGVAVPENVIRVNQAFLDDIAHGATPNPPSGYDAELLGSHFATGDGRGNENIALTAVHHVFHSEHNRVMEQIDDFLQNEAPAELRDRYMAEDGIWDYGERLFQAARFFTEMQYQHLVFEEFARRIQPNIDPTTLNENSYMPDVDPAIVAEFAHVVYRFGHSLLTEDIRREVNGEMEDIPLFDGFLNPQGYLTAPDGTALSPNEAAGSIIRGTTHQTANAIDEFVTDTLRNQLLGLPLDLVTINMLRARETGVPSLQVARQTFYEDSRHPELAPYTSWEDFRLAMKNPESILNFVAAYGIHPSLDVDTLDSKRAAAALLIEDEAFMTAPAAETGVNDIDFWMGGLAEKPFVFGGMLGTTFNVVFEQQLENLQNGDRFYYLTRNLGNSLFHTLEANSFSQLILRNTAADKLPHDVFAAAQATFDLSEPAVDLAAAGLQELDGWSRFTGGEHTTMQGTDSNDSLRGGIGDDSFWGRAGNDRIEGDDGADALMGGDGDDILTDLNGDDRLQGEAGNDALAGGPGVADLLFGGSGQDFILGGNDNSTVFGGLGNDFILGSTGPDNLRGDEGDDWIEGGPGGSDLLVGDLSNTMMNDPALWHGGHDVLNGGSGNADHDAEGGDDIMVAGTGTERFGGMLGFDWVTFKDNRFPARVDMDRLQIVPEVESGIRDRYLGVEAVAGWNSNDVIRGSQSEDDLVAPEIGTLGYGHRLTQEHLDRIAGLRDLLGGGELPEYALPFLDGQPTTPDDFNNNILLAGAGSDLVEPRLGRNFVDGDAWLDVNVVWRPADGAVAERAKSISAFSERIFNRTISPVDLFIERSVVGADANQADATDTIVYAETRDEFEIEQLSDGVIRVTSVANPGIRQDILRNVEQLQFSDETVDVSDGVEAPVELPAGTVNLNVGDLVEGQTVNATAEIPDPEVTDLRFELQIVDPGTGEAATTQDGTTGNFLLGEAEVGFTVQVVVTYTGGDGTPVQLVSEPTVNEVQAAP
ncbi:Animal haem peroxidase [Arthrobacter crystallopoietes]|uniref:Animal haem peroxidase n=1 Tax=Crystallibacter crystallopoietes TaxID=37928 RepID=A0A1H0ZBL7_9MICC|nr:hypothetical protein AC20117_15995 [Arthrobacter crystallopoietes]SDQ24749.1 Animal haem peroxidase [Arthrobacter crystallopoietes]